MYVHNLIIRMWCIVDRYYLIYMFTVPINENDIYTHLVQTCKKINEELH